MTTSPAAPIKIGIVRVARLAARAAGFPQTTRTSTGIETSSAANFGRRSSLPCLYRYSTMRSSPSIQPSCRNPSRKPEHGRKRQIGHQAGTFCTLNNGPRGLCLRRKRPDDGCAANEQDEFPPPHEASSIPNMLVYHLEWRERGTVKSARCREPRFSECEFASPTARQDVRAMVPDRMDRRNIAFRWPPFRRGIP